MFSNTGYMIEASMKDSKILGITKIKNNINSKPIFINENIYFLNSKNKIIKIN